jgi:hypothetical protein
MLFTVTYRENSGTKSHIELDVENRAAVWAELKRLGINAIAVTEGRIKNNKSGRCGSSAATSKFVKWGIILSVLTVVAVAAICCWPTAKEKNVESSAKVPAGKNEVASSHGKASETKVKADVKKVVANSHKAESAAVQAEKQAQVDAEKSASTNNQEEISKPKRKVVFTNPMDQLMAMVMPRQPGDAVPPVPVSDDMEFTPEQEKQMFEQLTANDDDSDEVLERKELVQAMRNEYAELKTKHGWKFVDYIKALEAKARLDNEILSESVTIHETVFNDPNISDEDYLKTLEKINKVLAERGIKGIDVPTNDDENDQSKTSKEKNK